MIKHRYIRVEDDGKAYYDNGVYIGDVLAWDDGFYVWFPDDKKGYLNEGFLLNMYELLHKLNEPMDKELEDFFSKTEREETPTDT